MNPIHCRERIEELENHLGHIQDLEFPKEEIELVEKTIRAMKLLGFLLDQNKEFGPFISGGSNIEQPDGLPEHLWICPALGTDILGYYKKEKVIAPEW